MMAGESRQQEVEAAGHAIPIIGKPRVMNTCYCPFLCQGYSRVPDPGEGMVPPTVSGSPQLSYRMEIISHRCAQRHVSSVF